MSRWENNYFMMVFESMMQAFETLKGPGGWVGE